VFDVLTTYKKVSGVASGYVTAPVYTHPTLALRIGGEKLWGDFPYFDAAFIGGSRSLRTEHGQRFAGDASLFGTTEVRVPLVHFPFVLPLNVGAMGFADLARVYLDGESTGLWHKGTGAGLWISFVRPELGVTILRTNNPDRRILFSFGFAF
jgi:outer membrane protein assembly factor BamA